MILTFLTSSFYREWDLKFWLLKSRLYGYYLKFIGFLKVEEGAGPVFVDPRISWVIEKGSRIEVKKSINPLKDPFIPQFPNGVFIGGLPQWKFLNPSVSRRTSIRLKENSKLILGSNVLICTGAYLSVWPSQTLEMESNVYLGHENYINTKVGLKFSDNTMTSHKVTMMDYDGHPIISVDHVKSHLATTESYGGKAERIIIEKNVWIGFESTILKGAHLKEGAIIGARSVVTDICGTNTISAGNPAKTLKEGVTWQKF